MLGLLLVRLDDERHARVRMFPQMHHRNAGDVIHGGTILGLVDVAMFAGSGLLIEDGIGRGVTVEVSAQFLGPGDPERPLDAVVEVTKETGRMVFTRGLIVQEGDTVASFSGILRKVTPKR
ncbi:MAG: PaaI family thioesterase [Alteraurantiacibacter sp.]